MCHDSGVKTSFRVLHCIHSLNERDGGPARSVPALAEAEALAGADVRVWSCQPPTIRLEEYHATRFVTGPLRTVISKTWTPDIIHDHGLWLPSNHSTAQAGRQNRIPRVVSPRGMLEPWCLQHRRYRKRFAWQLYQQRDLVTSSCLHATSEREAEQFRQLGLQQPIVMLPNGVTVPEAIQVRDQSETERSGEREVLFLSRIHPVKGLPHLVEAWQQVVQQGWRLRIVGGDEGGHKSEIKELVLKKRLGSSVMIGDAVHSDDKWKLLRDADVLILPSFSENFGIVVTEALAMGTPVITTTGTPWSEIRTRRCGWYVEPESRRIADALCTAMSISKEELTEMGDRGCQWVRESFAWPNIGIKMLKSYQWLLGRGVIEDCILSGESCDRPAA